MTQSGGENADKRSDERHRGIRISTDIWEAAKARAQSEDRSLSQVLREFLRNYADGK